MAIYIKDSKICCLKKAKIGVIAAIYAVWDVVLMVADSKICCYSVVADSKICCRRINFNPIA